MIKTGMLVKDSISGFVGVVMCRSEYLYGCVRIGVAPQIFNKKENTIYDIQWFDEKQLEILKEDFSNNAFSVNTTNTGGPRIDNPKSIENPKR